VALGPDDADEVLAEPTSGERLLYALGQIYRRWHTGKALVCPWRLDVEDVEELARLLGIWSDVEFAQEDEMATGVIYLHFPTEVLVTDCSQQFPWRLLDTWEWAVEQEHKEFWAFFH
jgi:hypothetical protein